MRHSLESSNNVFMKFIGVRISESLPFGSLALRKIEATEMLASKRFKASNQVNEHFSLGN